MSISSLTTLAVARQMRTPSKADAGAKPEGQGGNQPASQLDTLSKTVPTGLVAGYTGFIAIVTELAGSGTPNETDSGGVLVVRWIAFVVLVVAAPALTIISYNNKKTTGMGFPTAEVIGVTAVSAAWGLAVPGSPLLASITDKTLGAVVVALIIFIGIVINLLVANTLKSQAT